MSTTKVKVIIFYSHSRDVIVPNNGNDNYNYNKETSEVLPRNERNKIILTFENGMTKENIFAIDNGKTANSLIVNIIVNKIWYRWYQIGHQQQR